MADVSSSFELSDTNMSIDKGNSYYFRPISGSYSENGVRNCDVFRNTNTTWKNQCYNS